MSYKAIVIGTGAAGYSTADWLFKAGITDIAIITEGQYMGTSRNTGSDKQTYYKLSLNGQSDDCAYKLAQDIASGGACDGELAYIEAVNSVRCFYRLIEYGVGFPTDEYGGYAGYKTDHDEACRATSIGPLTSKVMTEKLEAVVLDRNKTSMLDHKQVVEILVDENVCKGVIVLDTLSNKFEKILAENVIVATGAPACVYGKRVYPISQHGMTGVLINSGCDMANYTEWQYGMASTKFRWNVSGSYMQALPRVLSIDEDGVEREFLSEYYAHGNSLDRVFLKGYQWPFDVNKINGSSRVDILVNNEIEKGRKVYLDYRQNSKGYDFKLLNEETSQYLKKCGANLKTPIERLAKINSKAIQLYKDNGIDLYTELLEIAVCAQHCNGGVKVDTNYMTTVQGLYAVGEVAGVFGVTRQGGTALNSTQVGGIRVAGHISKKKAISTDEKCGDIEIATLAKKAENFRVSNVFYQDFIDRMSLYAGFNRDREKMQLLLAEVEEYLNADENIGLSLSQYYYDRDMLVAAKGLLIAILGTMCFVGSRGGAMYIEKGNIVGERASSRKNVSILRDGKIHFEKVKDVPKKVSWFEDLLSKQSGDI